jgi:hypothetical protein
MPPKLLSGLVWRAAMIAAAVLLVIAVLYTLVQLISVLNSGAALA